MLVPPGPHYTPHAAGETLVIATPEFISAAVANAVRTELRALLPEALSRAALPPRLSKKAAASFSGLSERQLDTLRHRDRLRSYKVGRKVWFDTQDLLAYIDAGLIPARLKRRRG